MWNSDFSVIQKQPVNQMEVGMVYIYVSWSLRFLNHAS